MAIREIEQANGTAYIAYFKMKGRQYQKTFSTRKKAREWEAEEKKRLLTVTAMPQTLTYSNASRAYLEDCKARMASNTFKERLRHLREFAAFLQGDIGMDDITTAIARKFLLDNKADRGNKSANRRLRTLKALWNWHKDSVPRNPWRGIAPFAEEEYIKHVPTPEDVSRVLAVAEPWQKNLLNTLLHTGARAGEVLKLRWADVSDHSILLWTQKRKGGAKQSRHAPITPTLKTILDAQKLVTGDAEYVFINPTTGKPYEMRQPAMKYMLGRLCKEAEVSPFGFHAIRHFFAVSLVKSQQTDLTDIQRLLGHQRATTTDIYLRGIDPRLDHLAGVIEQAVQPVITCKEFEQADG